MTTAETTAGTTDTPTRTGPYARVMLKLSGEVFGGGSVGVDPIVVHGVATQIAQVVKAGTQVAVVVGGGNFFRGSSRPAWTATARTTWACSAR
jgi:uridylate kinase